MIYNRVYRSYRMQCQFFSNKEGKIIRGGYSLDKKKSQLQTSIVPIGLHRFGEDGNNQEPPEDDKNVVYVYQKDVVVVPQNVFDKFLDLASVKSSSSSSHRYTRKKH